MQRAPSLPHRILLLIARGAALAIGGFLAVALLLRLRSAGGTDAVIWLFDLRPLPAPIALVWTMLACATLLAFALQLRSRQLRLPVAIACAGCALIALANGLNALHLHASGDIHMLIPAPLSLLLAPILLGIGLVAWTQHKPARTTPARRLVNLIPVAVCAGAFAFTGSLAQMLIFGKTDYRRPAAIAVVFGSRVYADGGLSDALADRVRTACDLYEQGLTTHLLMSGGPGDGAIHEAEAMRRFAIERGIPDSAILLDFGGVNTAATIEHTRSLTGSMPGARVLMVSHSYHLPRIKLESDRAGLNAVTVPAKESYLLTNMPWFMTREVAAQWVYLLRPLI